MSLSACCLLLMAMAEMMDAQSVLPGAPGAASAKPAVAGDLRLHELRSAIFGNRRMLRVWLPPGYDASENRSRRYPVLYLNDGQNLFDVSTSYIGVEWQVDETADRLIREGRIPPMIIVGIDNAQKDRAREYLPYGDDSYQPPVKKVQGKRYPDFLVREVMPYIQRRYRVLRGPGNTALGGSSYGAAISLYTVLARPGVFGRLLLESPSLYIHGERLLRDSRKARRWPERVYLAVGTRETNKEDINQLALRNVRDLEGILRKAGLNERRLKVDVEEGAPHSESAWARRFPAALAFLFHE